MSWKNIQQNSFADSFVVEHKSLSGGATFFMTIRQRRQPHPTNLSPRTHHTLRIQPILGKPTKQIDANGFSHKYRHDANSNLIAQTDANGFTHFIFYDSLVNP
ncbi:RHS repeat domain-containing protein [Bathymodiolus thermophilus thioautotrophic gill symbiont]|uniref:RHS repeat domain-containing protein n=1 Tax=Bathymodiolus thermophilus thioautotrophic gill symbiont TaxID=2360 RepID=UPI000F07CE55|nr:RHS repeat domain-containing protein [Bathymodiolus thermophilus thioautotrophic gill symbiont]